MKGYIGPWSATGAVLGEESATGIRYLVDPRVADGSGWITGANIDGKHVFGLVAGRDFGNDGTAEVAEVKAGDPAPDGSGPVELARGMEIGHVFQLGRIYAETLGLKVLDENGKLVTVTMGSYGIGVTRIMAVIAEANNDEKGLIWPREVAPFDVHVIATGKDDVAYSTSPRRCCADLEAAGPTSCTTTARRSRRASSSAMPRSSACRRSSSWVAARPMAWSSCGTVARATGASSRSPNSPPPCS